jgi:hypothetical protein
MTGINTGLVSNVIVGFGGVRACGFGREDIEEQLSPKYVVLSLGRRFTTHPAGNQA